LVKSFGVNQTHLSRKQSSGANFNFFNGKCGVVWYSRFYIGYKVILTCVCWPG